ncbi:MAG: polymer-forming cytoskeletal protein [archaeon]|nr:polymer-forming cytoskeletal protein [archaeon]
MNSKRMSFCVLFGFIALLFAASGAFALQIESGERFVLAKDDVIYDDLIVGGSEIVIEGRIEGDLVAFAGKISISGDVEGDVLAAGGDVVIEGDVEDDAVLLSGDAKISGDVGDNLLAACGSFKMDDGSSVGRDAFVAGGMIDVYGDVFRNLFASGGNVVIGGSVLGNVTLEADGAPRITSDAEIGGDVNYTSEKDIIIEDGASVPGNVNKNLPDAGRKKSDFERFNERLMGFLSIFIVGFILVRFLPVYTRNVCNNLKKSAFSCGLWGIVGLIVAPVVALLLMVTVIGLPLGLILVCAYIILIYVSKVYVSVFVGKFFLNMTGSRSDSLVLMLVLGLLLFELIGLVPALSGFVGLLVVVFGFGAVLVTKKQMYMNFKKKKLV